MAIPCSYLYSKFRPGPRAFGPLEVVRTVGPLGVVWPSWGPCTGPCMGPGMGLCMDPCTCMGPCMGPMGPWAHRPMGPMDKFGDPTLTPIAVFLKNTLFQNFEHANSQIGLNLSDLVRFGQVLWEFVCFEWLKWVLPC